MTDTRSTAGNVAPGMYAPAGEAQGLGANFGADQVAAAFGVAVERVLRVMTGEFGL